jgi:quercetin dioxygenase-like cupin family protein
MDHFLKWEEHVGSNPVKFHKATLWQGEFLTVGLNSLEPGQAQKIHAHEEADKFYFVLEGSGTFTVGDEVRSAGPGSLIIAPAGTAHGVVNETSQRLSLLVAIAPPIK